MRALETKKRGGHEDDTAGGGKSSPALLSAEPRDWPEESQHVKSKSLKLN